MHDDANLKSPNRAMTGLQKFNYLTKHKVGDFNTSINILEVRLWG
jgi:hypothetical protein